MCTGWSTISIQKPSGDATAINDLMCWQDRSGLLCTATAKTVTAKGVPMATITTPYTLGAASVPANLAAGPSVPTKAEWTHAVQGAYEERQSKDDGDGVTRFMACFDAGGKPCALVFGRRDAFQRVRVFEPAYSILTGRNNRAYVRPVWSYWTARSQCSFWAEDL